MNLFRFKLEDRQFLPLQGISGNSVEQSAADRHHKRLVGKSCVNIVAIYFPKCDRSKRLLASLSLGSVLRSKRAKRQLQLRLGEAIFRQVGGNVFNKLYHSLILHRVNEAPDFT